MNLPILFFCCGYCRVVGYLGEFPPSPPIPGVNAKAPFQGEKDGTNMYVYCFLRFV